jgi:hypothetical protein
MITLKKNSYLKKHVTILKYVGSLTRHVLSVLCRDLTLFMNVIQDTRFIAVRLRGSSFTNMSRNCIYSSQSREQ